MNVNAIIGLKEYLHSEIIVNSVGRYQSGEWVGIDINEGIIKLLHKSGALISIDIDTISSIKIKDGVEENE